MIIGIDPGHGGPYSPGAVVLDEDGNEIQEKTLNLAIAFGVSDFLTQEGYKIEFSRASDASMGLRTRGKRLAECDVVISIHCNANSKPEIRGAECYHWPIDRDGSRRGLSEHILRHMPEAMTPRRIFAVDRDDWRKRAFNVVNSFAPPTVLVECGYMTNEVDLEVLRSHWGQYDVAKAIAYGVVEWAREREGKDVR